jgi:hypothetical protein
VPSWHAVPILAFAMSPFSGNLVLGCGLGGNRTDRPERRIGRNVTTEPNVKIEPNVEIERKGKSDPKRDNDPSFGDPEP